MTLSVIRAKFREMLSPVYGQDETDSFFWLLLEERDGWRRVDFALAPDRNVPEADLPFWESAMEALQRHVPIQYVIGHTDFCGGRFEVDGSVLIPRPETEELVGWIVSEASPGSRILDIGTGSGAIAVSLAKGIRGADVEAVDVSPEALETARRNAASNGVPVRFRQSDILSVDRLAGNYDIIVSNPPYVRAREKMEMRPNVLAHEPHLALFVEDDDPLLFYRKIAGLAAGSLRPGGALYFEINQYLGSETAALLEANGFETVTLRKDLCGNDRMLSGRRPHS